MGSKYLCRTFASKRGGGGLIFEMGVLSGIYGTMLKLVPICSSYIYVIDIAWQ